MAQLRRACPSYRRQLRADWSRRPDVIEFGDLPALALPRDKLAVATALRKCRDRRQPLIAGERKATVTAQ